VDIASWLKYAEAKIVSHSPRRDAELLLLHRLGKSCAYLKAFDREDISRLAADLECDLAQLQTGYPIAYVLGYKAFWDMTLKVTPAVLIPRPDTETLIEAMQSLFPRDSQATMVDLGTGSGAIAIALSRIFAKADITATDSSGAALDIAQENAKRWALANITFKCGHWLNGYAPHRFDAIVSNPPYIDSDDHHLLLLQHEPLSALVAADGGLADIKKIIQQSQVCLKTGGYLLLEHGYQQGDAVRGLLGDGWTKVSTHRDLAGHERVTMAKKY